MSCLSRAAITLAVVLFCAPLAAQTLHLSPECEAVFEISSMSDVARTVAVQPDGRLIVAGRTNSGGGSDVAVARFHPDLTLDTSFDADGWLTTDIGTTDLAFRLAIQSDGKILMAGETDVLGDGDFLIVRYNRDGSLDSSFDGDGIWTHDLGSNDNMRGIAFQKDGKIVAVGTDTTGNDSVVVFRLNKNGSLDNSFDGDGIRITQMGATSARAENAVLQDDGKILVVATVDTGTTDVGVLRLSPNGSNDPTFGGGAGFVYHSITGSDTGQDLDVQNDGKIVVAANAGGDIALIRFDAAGNLDNSFDSDGEVLIDVGGNDASNGVEIDANGKIVVGGTTNVNGDNDVLILRRRSDGSADAAFNGTGQVIKRVLAGRQDRVVDLAHLPDGRIVTVGRGDFPASNNDWLLELFKPDGTQACSQLTLHPTDDGSFTDFGPSGCAANWDCANDQTTPSINAPDGPPAATLAGSYNESASAGGRDMFKLGDAYTTGQTVFAIEVVAVAGDPDSVNPDVRLSYQRIGFDGTPVDSPTINVTNNGCCSQTIRHRWDGLNWGPAELDALEVGIFHENGSKVAYAQLYVHVFFGTTTVNDVFTFTTTSTGISGAPSVVLQWTNPEFGPYTKTEIWKDTGCAAPFVPSGSLVHIDSSGLGMLGSYTHNTGLSYGTTEHYSIFVFDGTRVSKGICTTARPVDPVGNALKWAYNVGGSAALTLPGIQYTGANNIVYTVANNGMVHAFEGGPSELIGGRWPAGWRPYKVGGKAEARPPIVSDSSGTKIALIGAEDGHVYAINATTGALEWKSPKLANTLTAGIAAIYTGTDYLAFVGTRGAGDMNVFYALDLDDGTIAWAFDNPPWAWALGDVMAGASVDWANKQLYFGTSTSTANVNLWCLAFGSGTPVACPGWPPAVYGQNVGADVHGSPVLYGGRIAVGDNGGKLHFVDPANGSTLSTETLSAGVVKRFPFPYIGAAMPTSFAADSVNVYKFEEGGSPSPDWTHVSTSPSTPLYNIFLDKVYFGCGTGAVVEVQAADGLSVKPDVQLSAGVSQIGSPSLDVLQSVLYVGSEEGIVYAVLVPF